MPVAGVVCFPCFCFCDKRPCWRRFWKSKILVRGVSGSSSELVTICSRWWTNANDKWYWPRKAFQRNFYKQRWRSPRKQCSRGGDKSLAKWDWTHTLPIPVRSRRSVAVCFETVLCKWYVAHMRIFISLTNPRYYSFCRSLWSNTQSEKRIPARPIVHVQLR